MKFLMQLISRLLAPLGHALPRPVLVPIPIQTRRATHRLTRRPGGQGD